MELGLHLGFVAGHTKNAEPLTLVTGTGFAGLPGRRDVFVNEIAPAVGSFRP